MACVVCVWWWWKGEQLIELSTNCGRIPLCWSHCRILIAACPYPPPSPPADIIHYQQRQLRRYRGNLSEFVKAVPTAKSYYELEAASLRFRCVSCVLCVRVGGVSHVSCRGFVKAYYEALLRFRCVEEIR